MKSAAGFSLIELVVVMVIATIIAAVMIPRFTDSETRAGGFYDEVKAGVRYAQRQAVAQRRCVFVQVAATQVRLLYGDASCVITATPLTFLATSQAGRSPGGPYILDAPNGVTLSPAASFSFNGLGQPSAGVTISVSGRQIVVNAETGFVQ